MKMNRWLAIGIAALMSMFWNSSALAAYVNNGNGTVTDTSTGLMWQQDTARDDQGNYDTMTWEEALAYCESRTLGGHTDWRLPTIKELRSLVDYTRYNPAINTTYFPNTVSSIVVRLLPMPLYRPRLGRLFRQWLRRLEP